VKNSQYERTVVKRLEDDQVISVCANPYLVAEIWTCHIVMRSVGNLLAVMPYFTDERDRTKRIVDRDVIADANRRPLWTPTGAATC